MFRKPTVAEQSVLQSRTIAVRNTPSDNGLLHKPYIGDEKSGLAADPAVQTHGKAIRRELPPQSLEETSLRVGLRELAFDEAAE